MREEYEPYCLLDAIRVSVGWVTAIYRYLDYILWLLSRCLFCLKIKIEKNFSNENNFIQMIAKFIEEVNREVGIISHVKYFLLTSVFKHATIFLRMFSVVKIFSLPYMKATYA